MPPVRKFKEEDIINKAYEIVEKEGFEGLNARRIAKELGCSVQPIFHNFSNMEELNRKVFEKICSKYREYLTSNSESEKEYKKTGLSYIKFAKDYPEFFKIMFMQKTPLDVEEFMMNDTVSDYIITVGQKMTGLSYEEQKKFHLKVWIFTHGIACLVANKTVDLKDDEIDRLLESTVREMLAGYLGGRKWKMLLK